MELIVDGNTVSQQATEADVTRALSELSTGQHNLVVLDNSTYHMKAQVARGTDGAYILEVTDQNLGSVMRSVEHFIDDATISKVFLSVLAGTHDWSTATQWVTGSGQAPSASSRDRAILMAAAILLALAVLGVSVFLRMG